MYVIYRSREVYMPTSAQGISSSKLPMTKVEGSIRISIYTDFTMVPIIYTVTMMSLRVIVQQNCSDIMCISGYLNLKFEC